MHLRLRAAEGAAQPTAQLEDLRNPRDEAWSRKPKNQNLMNKGLGI